MINQINQMIHGLIPFTQRNGYSVVELRRGYVKSHIPLETNGNHMGTMYAGALFLLAEIPGGVLCMNDFGQDYIPILRDMRMEFKAPARTDITLEVTLTEEQIVRLKDEVTAQGKTHFQLNGELKDSDGQVVALSTATYQMRKRSA